MVVYRGFGVVGVVPGRGFVCLQTQAILVGIQFLSFVATIPGKARRPSGDFRVLAANRTGDARDPVYFGVLQEQYKNGIQKWHIGQLDNPTGGLMYSLCIT